MWSIVKKVDDQELDIIPNLWILSSNSCRLPCKSAPIIAQWAKELKAPDDSWPKINIKIEKSDIRKYDRALWYLVRLSTVTDSDAELRGKGQHKHKKKRYDYEISSSDEQANSDSSSSDEQATPPKTVSRPPPPPQQKQALGAIKRSTNVQDTGSTISAPSTKISPTVPPPKNGGGVCSNTSSVAKSVDIGCGFKSMHICFYAEEVTLKSMAKQMCSLSERINILANAFQSHHAEVMSVLTSKTKKSGMKVLEEEQDQDSVQKRVQNILDMFPLNSVMDLRDLNEKAVDNSFQQDLILALLQIGKDKSSPARFVTAALRNMLGSQLRPQVTWKGHKRGGRKTEAFCDSPLIQAIINAVKIRWKEYNKELTEKTISGFLAQIPSKLKSVRTVRYEGARTS